MRDLPSFLPFFPPPPRFRRHAALKADFEPPPIRFPLVGGQNSESFLAANAIPPPRQTLRQIEVVTAKNL